jgi:hypothetical protein
MVIVSIIAMDTHVVKATIAQELSPVGIEEQQ